MAELKLTHFGEFSQEFSESIPLLKELEIWTSALFERAQQTLRAISVAYDEGLVRKRLNMIKDKVLPPQSLSALNIS